MADKIPSREELLDLLGRYAYGVAVCEGNLFINSGYITDEEGTLVRYLADVVEAAYAVKREAEDGDT